VCGPHSVRICVCDNVVSCQSVLLFCLIFISLYYYTSHCMAKHRCIYLRNANWCWMSIADYDTQTHSHAIDQNSAGRQVICCGRSAYLEHAASIVAFGG